MQSNRDLAISETLKWEGGYTNDAADPGGPTNWGITIADAKRYWKKDATAADVKAMPKSVAINIYATKYWKTSFYDCDKLAAGVDLAVFDFGVNSGPSRAKKALDASVGGTPADVAAKVCDKRLAFLKGLGTWSNFGKGWGRRVAGIKAKSIEMANAPTNTSAHAGAGAVVVAGSAVAATHAHNWLLISEIAGATILAAVILWLAISWYKNKGKV